MPVLVVKDSATSYGEDMLTLIVPQHVTMNGMPVAKVEVTSFG